MCSNSLACHSIICNLFSIPCDRRAGSAGSFSPALYQGLSIHTCSQCERPRLQLLGFSPHPFVSQLNEFPRSECYTFQDRCSSCGRQELRQSLSVDWWQQLDNMFWLRFNWDEGCCFEWIVSVQSLKAVLESLQCDDLHIVQRYTER